MSSGDATGMRVRLGDWRRLGEDASRIREAVFVVEQRIAREDEWDQWDQPSLHAVAYDDRGSALGTARLLPDGSLGRFAVLAPARGRGIGTALLEALLAAARERGLREVTLSAQSSAEAFYARHGFAAVGDRYLEVGIEHVRMRCGLSPAA